MLLLQYFPPAHIFVSVFISISCIATSSPTPEDFSPSVFASSETDTVRNYVSAIISVSIETNMNSNNQKNLSDNNGDDSALASNTTKTGDKTETNINNPTNRVVHTMQYSNNYKWNKSDADRKSVV